MANRQPTVASNTSGTSVNGLRRSIVGSVRNRINRVMPTRRPPPTEPPPPYSAAGNAAASVPASAPAPAPAPVPDVRAELDGSYRPPSFAPAHQAPVPAPATVTAHASPPSINVIRDSSPAPSIRSFRSTNSRLTVDSVRRAEEPYAFLATFDTVFVIDDSGSMAGRPWHEVQKLLAAITPICTKYDADGIDLYFLNHRCTQEQQTQLLGRPRQANQPRVPPGKAAGGFHGVSEATAVGRIFGAVKPGQSTPTGMRLRTIFQPYLRYYEAKRNEMRARGEYGDPDAEEVKPMNIIVITDGVPTDDLDDALIEAAKKLDAMDAPPYQVGVQFFQVGTEPEAAAYLRHLDDTLGQDEKDPIRDMVDTVTWDLMVQMPPSSGGGSSNGNATVNWGLTVEGILKVVLGAVVKRLDNTTVATRGGRGGAAQRGGASPRGGAAQGGGARRSNTNTLHP